jgi:hypothetical protein
MGSFSFGRRFSPHALLLAGLVVAIMLSEREIMSTSHGLNAVCIFISSSRLQNPGEGGSLVHNARWVGASHRKRQQGLVHATKLEHDGASASSVEEADASSMAQKWRGTIKESREAVSSAPSSSSSQNTTKGGKAWCSQQSRRRTESVLIRSSRGDAPKVC